MKGSFYDHFRRVLTALLSIEKEVVRWPDEDERREISTRFMVTYGFRNCVGVIDGTLLFLRWKPKYCGEDYNTRKGGYGINCTIICDDNGKILDYYAGWPGCTHDSRVWTNSKWFLHPEMFFSHMDYLLGMSDNHLHLSFSFAIGIFMN